MALNLVILFILNSYSHLHILVTGGCGYIGSHTVVELLLLGYRVSIVDNLSNSKISVVDKIERITGHRPSLFQVDCTNQKALSCILQNGHFDAVIHMAGYKAVSESILNPIKYYQNNLVSTLTLIREMARNNISKLIFSSSATVYGSETTPGCTENLQTGRGITNPYGQSKYMIEQILKDYAKATPAFELSILRYFNPIGNHPSGIIGEDPATPPTNLMPVIVRVATGRKPHLDIFGTDYPTKDGTCLRDYIHVVDLAKGHIQALRYSKKGVNIYNLGTGIPQSVMDLVHEFEHKLGRTIPKRLVDRRPGDLAIVFADATKAERELNWKAQLNTSAAVDSVLSYLRMNPSTGTKDFSSGKSIRFLLPVSAFCCFILLFSKYFSLFPK